LEIGDTAGLETCAALFVLPAWSGCEISGSGHFGFAGHNDLVMFRNITIKTLA
jgi:hypothetical protein